MSIYYKTSNTPLAYRKYGTFNVYYYSYTDGMWIWETGAKYYMSASVGVPVRNTALGANITPMGWIYNGRDVYAVGLGWYLWYCGTVKTGIMCYWVISKYIGYGLTTPRSWYYNTVDSMVGTFKGGGSYTGSADRLMYVGIITGRECSTISGLYIPVTGSGVTGNKRLGWKKYPFTGDYVGSFFCETNVTYNSYPVYEEDLPRARKLWYSGTGWYISPAVGLADAWVGYWSKGVGTDPVGTYSNSFNGDGEPSPETYTLSTPVHVENNPLDNSQVTENILIGRTATWQ